MLKDTIQQLNKLSDTDENKEKKGHYKTSKLGLIDKDIIQNITNFEDVSIKIDGRYYLIYILKNIFINKQIKNM